MAKRLIDTDVWDNKWFRTLPVKMKAAWLYIRDKCDNAGVWEEDCELMSYQIGAEVSLDELTGALSGRIKKVGDTKIWITGFCEETWGFLDEDNVKNYPHQAYIRLLKKHGLWNEYLKQYKTTKKPQENKSKSTRTIKEHKESFEIFWDEYHRVTKRPKEDKEPAFTKWKQLSYDDQVKAFKQAKPYSKTNDSNYLKKARTYLEDKSFNNEIMPVNADDNQVIKGNFYNKGAVHA